MHLSLSLIFSTYRFFVAWLRLFTLVQPRGYGIGGTEGAQGVQSCPLGITVLLEPVSVDIHLHPMTCAETDSSAAEVLGRGVATAVYWSEGRVGLGRTPLPPAYLPHAQGARGCSNTAPRRYLGSGCSSLGVHFIGVHLTEPQRLQLRVRGGDVVSLALVRTGFPGLFTQQHLQRRR